MGRSGLATGQRERNTGLSTETGGREASAGLFGPVGFCKADATMTSSAPRGDLGGICSYQPRARRPCGWGTKIQGATGLVSGLLVWAWSGAQGHRSVLPEGQAWSGCCPRMVGLEVKTLSVPPPPSLSLSLPLSSAPSDSICKSPSQTPSNNFIIQSKGETQDAPQTHDTTLINCHKASPESRGNATKAKRIAAETLCERPGRWSKLRGHLGNLAQRKQTVLQRMALKRVAEHFQAASTTALGGLKAVTVPAGVYQIQTSDSGYGALAGLAGSVLDITILLNAFFEVHVIHYWVVFHA